MQGIVKYRRSFRDSIKRGIDSSRPNCPPLRSIRVEIAAAGGDLLLYLLNMFERVLDVKEVRSLITNLYFYNNCIVRKNKNGTVEYDPIPNSYERKTNYAKTLDTQKASLILGYITKKKMRGNNVYLETVVKLMPHIYWKHPDNPMWLTPDMFDGDSERENKKVHPFKSYKKCRDLIYRRLDSKSYQPSINYDARIVAPEFEEDTIRTSEIYNLMEFCNFERRAENLQELFNKFLFYNKQLVRKSCDGGWKEIRDPILGKHRVITGNVWRSVTDPSNVNSKFGFPNTFHSDIEKAALILGKFTDKPSNILPNICVALVKLVSCLKSSSALGESETENAKSYLEEMKLIWGF